MINVLSRQQEPQSNMWEQNFVDIPVFTRSNQDPIEWLEAVDRAFEANNIVGKRRLSVVGAYLLGLAAFWWMDRRNKEPKIQYWNNEFIPEQSFQRIDETVDQYATDVLVLFRRLMKVGNQYPEVIKAQMVVRGLRPDLYLAVGPFMPNTIQEAIDRAQMCKLTFGCELAFCGTVAIYNTVFGSLPQQPYSQQSWALPPQQVLQSKMPMQQSVPFQLQLLVTNSPSNMISPNSMGYRISLLQEQPGHIARDCLNVIRCDNENMNVLQTQILGNQSNIRNGDNIQTNDGSQIQAILLKWRTFVKPQELCEIGSTKETYEESTNVIHGELEHSSNLAEGNDLEEQNILGWYYQNDIGMIEENSDVKTLSKNNRKTLVGGGEYDKEEKCDLPKRLLEKEALQHECEKWIEKYSTSTVDGKSDGQFDPGGHNKQIGKEPSQLAEIKSSRGFCYQNGNGIEKENCKTLMYYQDMDELNNEKTDEDEDDKETLVDDDNWDEKVNVVLPERPLEREALYRKCEKWLRKVSEFRMTAYKEKELNKIEPTKEMFNRVYVERDKLSRRYGTSVKNSKSDGQADLGRNGNRNRKSLFVMNVELKEENREILVDENSNNDKRIKCRLKKNENKPEKRTPFRIGLVEIAVVTISACDLVDLVFDPGE
ncbi:11784_t:CDS:2 [Ambispora leptoticha]|uniref:11784_t:CDS:1 n=1 Tax=Ambispora leptoticha TaxID=144679 RepID=A0A9N9HIP6_9GLOM|nr:11784_t:CDS:2 [Ambispora leptoticha]